MRRETIACDLTVVGGGLAGVAAAIAAARAGASVSLVQNRPVLGGNSSSEIRVWVVGATAHGEQTFARETGIMGELFLENQYRNREGNPVYWDLVLLEAVRAEPNIRLFLDTDVRTVDADGPEGDRRIHRVHGWQMGAERELTFESDAFIDCSGDGLVGFLAGARFRMGREARADFGEPWAPEVADDVTLGSTILFYVKDAGRPVRFEPPSFARDIASTSILEHRRFAADDNGCAYWWIEWGGELDIVHDNDTIRDELHAVIYGIWDHIKNSGRFDADDLTLEWVGSVPGKREYRRFIGDHVLTQHDVIDQTEFEDTVGFGGWSIDLHPPGGVYSAESGSRHLYPDGVYPIPLRSFYSVNVRNLWFAGRTMSATHVAFGTTRVMATCAVGGEAAGLGAAIALRLGVTPRELVRDHFDVVRDALVRTDASVVGVENNDPRDLARLARVFASTSMTNIEPPSWVAGVEAPAEHAIELDRAIAIVVPVDPRLDGVDLLVDSAADTKLTVRLLETSRPQNTLPHREISRVEVGVLSGRSWVHAPLSWSPAARANAVVVVGAAPGVRLPLADEAAPGIVAMRERPLAHGESAELWRAWKPLDHHHPPRVRLTPNSSAWSPRHAVGGFARPWAGPNLWASASMNEDPEPWLTIEWAEPQAPSTLELVFDDDVQEDLINLHHHETPFDVLPTLVRDYRVEGLTEGGWGMVAEVTGNRRRRRVHPVDPSPLSAIRLTVLATNGSERAHLVAMRAYADPTKENEKSR